MRYILVFALIVFLEFFPESACAFSFSLEPIVSYERVQKLTPVEHSRDRMAYGGRLSAGLLFLKTELEYTEGQDSETFSDQNLSIREKAQRIKAGLRGDIRIWGFCSVFARAGVQARQIRRTESVSGADSNDYYEPFQYHPYGGAGLRIGLGSHVQLTADFTVIFTQYPKFEKNDYQLSSGFSVKLP